MSRPLDNKQKPVPTARFVSEDILHYPASLEIECSHMSESKRDQQKNHPAEPNPNYLPT